MDTSLGATSPLLGCSPIGLLEWDERPGRPLRGGHDWLAARLGATRDQALRSLDALLDGPTRARLDRELAVLESASLVCIDIGVIGLRVPDSHDAWFHVTIQRDGSGRGGARCLATAIDVTAAKRLELELAEKSARLELVLEGTRLGTWDWNPMTGQVSFNERWAEMLGHDLAEIRPSLPEWERRVHPDDLVACFEAIQAHIDGRTPFYENVHRMRHKNGEWRYILDRGKVVERDAEGRPIRFTGTHTDITEQKVAELRALEAAQAKSQFLATMSHEIRTPLNGILGLLQVLDGTTLDERQKELVSLVTQSGEHLLVIINDILDLAKAEAGKLRIDPHPFHIAGLVDAIVNLYAERAAEKHLELTLAIEDSAQGWALADSHRLHQVLGNLVSNAIKFTERGAVRVTVACADEGDTCWLTARVTDTGKGIQDVQSIFERFRQEDASIARTHGGTGLGLAISRALTELMGGALSVESVVGVGSTFTVRVPTRRHAAASPLLRDTPATPDAAIARLRVLVAEDNPVNRRVADGMLRRFGIEATFAFDGAEALDRCRGAQYDLVLMDIHMPRMDGLQATRAILAAAGARPPRIVALSADVLDTNREQCVAAGVEGFLGKPFRLNELEHVLVETVERARAA